MGTSAKMPQGKQEARATVAQRNAEACHGILVGFQKLGSVIVKRLLVCLFLSHWLRSSFHPRSSRYIIWSSTR